MNLRVAILCSLLLLFRGVAASDQQREQEYARYLRQAVAIGQVVRLNDAAGHGFLALFTEANKADHSNAAIVLHDFGQHPDQQPLLHGLRTIMPFHSWSALAIQLPLREMGAGADAYYGLFDEARGRIKAAVEFLRNNGAQNIALIGVGTGAEMAVYALSIDPNALFAVVTISLPLPNSELPQARMGEFIKAIALPFFDIYAEFDLPDVVDSASQRWMLGKDNPVYRQLKINGESHGFRQNPEGVIKRVYSWLNVNLDSN